MSTLTLPLIAGARLELEGTCNRCGLCCTAEHKGQRLVCEYLLAEMPPQPLGSPMASKCRVYESRDTRFPLRIMLLDAHGEPQLKAQCFKDAWQEDHVIADRGLGKGCSLTIPVMEAQLVSFTPDRRA